MSELKLADSIAPKALTFEEVDWTKRDDMLQLFPPWFQEQVKLIRAKSLSKAVNIEDFNLKTPLNDRYLLQNTSLILEANKRSCLYGANGTGKSTLFHAMANGQIKDFPKHIFVHHCKEMEHTHDNESVLDTVVHSHPLRQILVKCEAKLRQEFETAEGERKAGIKDNLDYVVQQMNKIQGYTAVERAQKMLRVLGFDETGQARKVNDLSGGLRMRVSLCCAFFMEPELLLLDEPTNHLDFPSVLWLENRLRGYKQSFLLVTHDRELLVNVTTSVLLLEDSQIHYYACGFGEFEKRKAKEDKKKFDDIEKFLARNRNVDYSTALGRQKKDKQEWSENYYRRQVMLAGKFTFPAPRELTNDQKDEAGNPVAPDQISLINLQNVRFSYNPETSHFIFNTPISFNVKTSTRVGVMGPNGAGKSTFLKLLTHKLTPTEGKVDHHPNFTLAYFGQHSTLELDLKLTPSEFMQREFPDVKVALLKQHLNKTGVSDDVSNTRVESLSFSQRSCVIFAKLTFVCPHLLIMDEPTNFLDLESVDSLISATNKYKGALLLVSHNRDFLRKCAKQFLSIVPGQFNLFDDIKTAERSTYTFIQEMEEGGRVGGDLLTKVASGGSVHASQVVGGEKKQEEKKKVGPVVISASDVKEVRTVRPAAAVEYKAGDKVLALWDDGKHYVAQIQKMAAGKYTVKYLEYGNTKVVPATSLKPIPAKPAQGGKVATGGPKANPSPAPARNQQPPHAAHDKPHQNRNTQHRAAHTQQQPQSRARQH